MAIYWCRLELNSFVKLKYCWVGCPDHRGVWRLAGCMMSIKHFSLFHVHPGIRHERVHINTKRWNFEARNDLQGEQYSLLFFLTLSTIIPGKIPKRRDVWCSRDIPVVVTTYDGPKNHVDLHGSHSLVDRPICIRILDLDKSHLNHPLC